MEMFKDSVASHRTARDFFSIIFKHYKKVMFSSLAIILIAVIGTLLSPEIYQSEAKLFVRLGSETLNQDSVTGQRIQISQTLDTQLNSMLQLFQSREMAMRLYEALGPQAFETEGNPYGEEEMSLGDKFRATAGELLSIPRKWISSLFKPSAPMTKDDIARKKTEAAVLEILGNLEAEVVPESNIIVLRYEDVHPEKAYDALAQLIDLYMARHIELNNSPGSYDFFKQQSDSLKQKLETAEAEFKQAKNDMGIASLEEHRTILSAQSGHLQQKLEETQSGIASSLARITSLKSKLGSLPENLVLSETTGSAMSAGEEMRRRLYELKLQEQELLSTFKADSVPVAEIHRQITEAEALLSKSGESRQVTTGTNPMHQDLEIELMLENGSLEALRARETVLIRQIRDADTELQRLNTAEVRLAQLQRQKELLEQNYTKYADNLEQVRIDKAREIEKLSNISIAQAPVIPLEPVRPQKSFNLLLGLILALFGGFGLAFLMEYLDDTLRKPEEIEEVLQLPVLGSIEKLSDK